MMDGYFPKIGVRVGHHSQNLGSYTIHVPAYTHIYTDLSQSLFITVYVLLHARTHTHTYVYTLSVRVKRTLCGYVMIRGVKDTKHNVLNTAQYLLQREWVSP